MLDQFFKQFTDNDVVRVFYSPERQWQIETWKLGHLIETTKLGRGITLEKAVENYKENLNRK